LLFPFFDEIFIPKQYDVYREFANDFHTTNLFGHTEKKYTEIPREAKVAEGRTYNGRDAEEN